MNAAPGSAAELIEELGLILYVGAGVIFVVVIALALYAAFGAAKPISARRWVIGGGLVFPSVTLSVLLIHSLWVGNALDALGASSAPHAHGARSTDAPLRVEIVGKQWWWEVRYVSDLGPRLRALLSGTRWERSRKKMLRVKVFWVNNPERQLNTRTRNNV